MTDLVGRDAEAARLAEALDRARAGTPTVALVVGDDGMGKSSLIATVLGRAGRHRAGRHHAGRHHAGRQGGDTVVAYASGDEAEAGFDYGVLDQLTRGVPIDAETRARLQAALWGGSRAEPQRVGAAVLRVLDASPQADTLVVVVDDAQWADRATLETLSFVARRLRADPVLLCLACLPAGVERLPPGLVRLADDSRSRIELAPLTTGQVAELARLTLGRTLPSPAAERLRTHTAGNPLHTRALLSELPYEALTRRDALPAPRSYATLVLSRLAGCSPAAQDLLMALAVLGSQAPLPDVASVAGIEAPLPAVDELVERELARVIVSPTDRILAFAHGLVQASVAADVSPSRRAAFHAAAARITTGDDALRHRLAAAHGPEPEVVAAARSVARRHVAAGERVAAARLLLAAAPLAATVAERQHLVAVAAAHLMVAGQPLGRLAGDVARLPDCAHHGYVMACLAVGSGAPGEAVRLLARAWDQIPSEPEAAELAGTIADMLGLMALHETRLDDVVAWGRRALATSGGSTVSATLICLGLALQGRFAEAESEMSALLAAVAGHADSVANGAGAPAVPDAADADPDAARTAEVARLAVELDARLGRGIVRVWSDDLAGADRDLSVAAALVGKQGTFMAEVNVRSHRAEIAFRAGRWSEALDQVEATASLVDDSEQPWLLALPHGIAAAVLASQGRFEAARAHARVATAGAEVTKLVPARLWAAQAWFRLAVASGDHDEVVGCGDRMVAEGWDRLPDGVHRWRASYVESLVAVGRPDAAATVARQLAQAAAAGATAPTPAVTDAARRGCHVLATEAARAQGAAAAGLGHDDAADAAFAAGLAVEPARTLPFERALLELAAGTYQRRTGRRRAAAGLLTVAMERFEALGAAPWYERAASEIERCGLQPRKRSDVDDRALTAQERLVAHLVADGRTNREVAAELVISVKTVEHHLGRVYAKLGLRSRTELAARLAPAATPDG